MKTLVASLLISLSAVTSSTTFAQDGNTSFPTEKTQTAIIATKNGKVDVLVGKTDGKVLIQVIDQQGKTLVTKPVTKHDVTSRIRFDLNELPDGVYEVVITEGMNREVKDIVLDTHTSTTYRTVTMS